MRRVSTIINGKRGYIMARPRKKLKEGVLRYPGGQIVHADRGEKPEDAMRVALAQPHRRGEKDPRAGYVYGKMRLQGIINQRQFDAAQVFVDRVIPYLIHVGTGVPRFPSVAADMVARGVDCKADMTVERIAKIRSDYKEIQDALSDGGLQYSGDSLLVRVCIMDKDLYRQSDVGDFRCALNLIAHRLRI